MLFTLLSTIGYIIGFLFGFIPTRERRNIVVQASLFLPKPLPPFFPNKVFGNVGRNFLEILAPRLDSIEKDQHQVIPRGTLILTAHLGNWELLGLAGSQILGTRLHVIARKARHPLAHKLLCLLRDRLGLEIIWRDNKKTDRQAIVQIKETLKRSYLCALLDQDTHTKIDFPIFFGLPSATPVTLLDIARKENAGLLFSVLIRTNNSSIFAKPKFKLITERLEEYDPQVYSNMLEALIRQYPDTWVWFHKRWRTQPNWNLEHTNLPKPEKGYYRLSSKEYREFLLHYEYNSHKELQKKLGDSYNASK